MELVAENGCVVSIPSGCKRKLGRGSELAIFDKTVSRDQVLVEFKQQKEKVSSEDHYSAFYGLFIQVLGANPVCILHIRQSTGGRSDTQEVVFLKKGEKDIMFVGDKISLSLSHPQFFTVQVEGKNSLSPLIKDRPGNLAEDDLLQKSKDRKYGKVAGPSVYHAASHSDALANMCLAEDRDIAANEEEEGIAQAVERRQKRALERRQQQALKLHDERTKETADMSDVLQVAHEQEDAFIKTQNIDPIKDFGFLVEGSEFDQYKNHRKSNRGRWLWPPSPSNAGFSSDDDVEDMHTLKHGRKPKAEDDEEWRGDDQQEEVAIASAKQHRLGGNLNLRSNEPSTSKIRDISMTKTKQPGGRMAKNRREELEESEDEADETLGGFIVNDNEEDLKEDADDEEEESEEEDLDEADEEEDDEIDEADEDLQQAPTESAKKKEEKPLCKYGKNCYRKNPDHLAQFRH